jgi:hypothetical protein
MASSISAGTTSSTALVATADTTGALVLQTNNGTTALTLDTSQNATFAGYANLPNTFGFKNRIINGAMVIDQRNAGASVTPTDGAYTLDRWIFAVSQTSKLTTQQNAGSVTPPAGFSKYLGVTSSSAYTLLAGDYFALSQKIEGFNFADMAWGTASAATVTLSFWVRSSLTGTFGGTLNNSAFNRNYPFTYTISSANTWEQKSVTVAGDTSGTWVGATSGIGLSILFGLGIGSTYSGTSGAWTSSTIFAPTGATSVVGTSGATFYITGVQLEKGSTATSFDYRPYGTELFLCQRYFEKSYNIGTVAGTATESGMAQSSQNATAVGTGYIGANIAWKVPKRAAPTTTLYDVAGTINTTTRYTLGGSTGAGQNGTVQDSSENMLSVYSSGTSLNAGIKFQYIASAEL